ncbi:hypothetical protein [Nostoc sp.]
MLVVCQIHFDGYRDAINRRLYKQFIRQLVLDRLLGATGNSPPSKAE